ncbi:MAG: acylglycerol kinase family protein, partial [Lachnospiraceae bacterium]|nr:acylglycerol kinase family protein [Lachnospiraceae bacterium]
MLFVYNPRAGKERIRENLAEILELFAERGYEMTVVPTQARDEARQVVKDRSKDFALVVCSGGDG